MARSVAAALALVVAVLAVASCGDSNAAPDVLSEGEAIEQQNESLLEWLSCAETDQGLQVPERTYRTDGALDLEALLLSYESDAQALSLLIAIEACGGYPAPNVPPEEFELDRSCRTHDHGSGEHSHGDC